MANDTQRLSLLDLSYYRASNADVARAYGTDDGKVRNHWLQYGIHEGRQPCSRFSPRAYRDRYDDLKAAYGDDWERVVNHWLQYGRAEGRNPLPVASGDDVSDWLLASGLDTAQETHCTIGHALWYYLKRGAELKTGAGKVAVANLAPVFLDGNMFETPLLSYEENDAPVRVKDLAWYLEGWLTVPGGPAFQPTQQSIWDSGDQELRVKSWCLMAIQNGRHFNTAEIAGMATGVVSAAVASGGVAAFAAYAVAWAKMYATASANDAKDRAEACARHQDWNAQLAVLIYSTFQAAYVAAHVDDIAAQQEAASSPGLGLGLLALVGLGLAALLSD